MQRHAPNPGNQTIGQHRGNLARDQFVPPVLRQPENHVITFTEFLQQARNVCRIVLHVGVHRYQHFTGRSRSMPAAIAAV